MTPRRKLILCLSVNSIILAVVVSVIFAFATESEYWRLGWSESLIVISVRINSGLRYAALLFALLVVNVARVLVEEFGIPVLGFSVYNPDKRHITDFSRNELQFFANSMFLVSNLRNLFMTLVAITQIDIALWSLFVSEITTFYTIRTLLNEKTFSSATATDAVELLEAE
jgi:hypothetical protein